MPTHRQFVVRTTMGLLFIVMAAGCSLLGPDLAVEIDNTVGPKEVTVTVDSSGAGRTAGEDVTVAAGTGAAWSVPLGSTWEVMVDGKHVIGSGDQTDLALPSPDHGQDVTICVRVATDGTLKLIDACR